MMFIGFMGAAGLVDVQFVMGDEDQQMVAQVETDQIFFVPPGGVLQVGIVGLLQ